MNNIYCENCGNKIELTHKFCIKCGHSAEKVEKRAYASQNIVSSDKWWHRLLKVLYVIAYLPLLGIISLVWSENLPYCSTYSNYCSGSYGEAFWYSLLTLVIYAVILRLVKIAVLYITCGQMPEWKKQFKKLF